MTGKVRIVLDTNVLARAVTDDQSPSGKLVAACESRLAVILLSKAVVTEYRKVFDTVG